MTVRYAKLPLLFDTKAMQTELLAAGENWQPHLNTYHYSGSWTVFPLRSPGGDHKNILPDLMGKDHQYQDTPFMEQFRSVTKLLSIIHCPVMSVRFLNLQAGAVIKEHRDNELAFEKGEARLHFPVFTNNDVEFYCENERIILAEGECWYLNANLPHRVTNNSDKDRIHLVIDCKVNEWLKDMISSSEKMAFKKEEVDDNLLNMIKHLRYQNTEASNKHADELDQKVKNIQNDSQAT
ncbi:aspartyl/asparaginyl beta-hydroxylase domain-containing protein [Mucilaginibacter sp.]|uniref:aspartyl/asparaginyl beta-hydroxylase domain-containing protein n=1 Tax=Mucilaginibacter sp. TaxID=1882438 RepID=UPI00284A7CC3|nr:aspartyl/asparaginyl beta-hydroxylase domain-containing protein [Mucilaginibacter sp.]MDR3697516.1 aspartyl/asparaginyl beta-hydroxylase domain-containing protein [Mucilaginibacter sp.]